ncbi:MAG TPA: lactonase family protein [Verrucomicrobiae bacterium]|nr:lactonase family protein [Verrucomicrobiae bacterium]
MACRKLFVVLAAMVFAIAVPAKEFLVYFGTYTNALSKGIYVSRLDAKTGKFSEPVLAAAVGNPNYVNLSPDGKYLYSSSSVRASGKDGDGLVSAFSVDRVTGRLTLLNQMSAGSYDPCYVSVADEGKVLLVASYDNGSVKCLPLESDGSIGHGGSFTLTTGHGPNANRQAGPHAHFITADPSGHFALECDLGTDRVMIYKINPADATLTANATPFTTVPPGSGARHLAFSRDGKFAYVVNEMACTVTTFAWNEKDGVLTPVETVPALPPGVAVKDAFTGAEILVHPTGKHVYATLRGHDSVSVFSADKKTGHLTFVQNVPAGGLVPRGLGIDPTGHWLITGNQKSDNAAIFAIDTKTGKLTATGQSLVMGSPVDVKFVEAK